jgi:endophilin-A
MTDHISSICSSVSIHVQSNVSVSVFADQVELISQLATFAEGLLDYHQQCTEVLRSLTETLLEK